MTVGVLLITHEGIGSALLAVATRLLRQLPLKTEAFEVPFDGSLLQAGENTLVLTVPAGPLTSGVIYDYLRLELDETA